MTCQKGRQKIRIDDIVMSLDGTFLNCFQIKLVIKGDLK